MSQPWICPKCQRGVAPTERYCDHGQLAISPTGPPAPIQPPVKPPGITQPYPWTSIGIGPDGKIKTTSPLDRKDWPFDAVAYNEPKYVAKRSLQSGEPVFLCDVKILN